MQIREAQRKDVPCIVRLLADDQLGVQREVSSERLPPEYLEAFDRINADSNNILAVVDDGVVIATLQLTFIPYLTHRGSWRAQVEGIRVARARRGQGVGRFLMDWAEEQARLRGCRMMQLTSNKDRLDAHAFYRSLGYQATHQGFKRLLTSNGP